MKVLAVVTGVDPASKPLVDYFKEFYKWAFYLNNFGKDVIFH
jgi:hypothetical protein